MKLRDCISRDRDTVINLDDFAQEVVFEGHRVRAQVDAERLGELSGFSQYAMGQEGIVIYAKTEDLPKRKQVGAHVHVDGSVWTVLSWESDMGVSEVALQRAD